MIQIPKNLKRPVPFQEPNYQKGGHISYDAHLRAYVIYSAIFGDGQSADRMAKRGGFESRDLDVFYPEWRNYIIKEG